MVAGRAKASTSARMIKVRIIKSNIWRIFIDRTCRFCIAFKKVMDENGTIFTLRRENRCSKKGNKAAAARANTAVLRKFSILINTRGYNSGSKFLWLLTETGKWCQSIFPNLSRESGRQGIRQGLLVMFDGFIALALQIIKSA